MDADEVREQYDKLFKLSEFEEGTVLEVSFAKRIKTKNGEAMLVHFATRIGREEVEGKLIIPDRFGKEIEGKTPLILYYGGMKKNSQNVDYHDLMVIELPEGSKKKGKLPATKPKPSTSDNAVGSFSDAETIVLECAFDSDCQKPPNSCYGFCEGCGRHQPYNGSQCRC